MEPDALYGLVIAGAVILLLITSFDDLLPASAVATTAGAQQAVTGARQIQSLGSGTLSPPHIELSARPLHVDIDGWDSAAPGGFLSELPSPVEAEHVNGKPAPVIESSKDKAGRQTDAALPPVTVPVYRPAYHTILGTEGGWGHRGARAPAVHPDAAPASHGTWLYAPTSNGG
jgi:hypothetical protein